MSLCRIIDLFGEAPIIVVEKDYQGKSTTIYKGDANKCPDDVQHKQVLDGGIYGHYQYVIIEVEGD